MTIISHSYTNLIMCLQTKSSHLSKELDCTTLCNSFFVLFINIYYVILICVLLFTALIGSGELCSSCQVLFGIQIYMYFMSDAPVSMCWQLPDYSIFDLFVCFLVHNYVFLTT